MKCEYDKTQRFTRITYDKAWRPKNTGRHTGGTSGIYGLTDPREPNRVRYVGSSRCIETRLYGHAHSHNPTDRHARAEWLRALRADNVRPEALVLAVCEVGETGDRKRHELEQDWVERLWAAGQADLNTRLTPIGHPTSADSRAKSMLRELQEENRKLHARVVELEALLRAMQTEDLA